MPPTVNDSLIAPFDPGDAVIDTRCDAVRLPALRWHDKNITGNIALVAHDACDEGDGSPIRRPLRPANLMLGVAYLLHFTRINVHTMELCMVPTLGGVRM